MTCPTILRAKTSGFWRASVTLAGSSGQPGAIVAYPASSNRDRQRSQLLESSHNPCTNTTTCRPDPFARSMSCTSVGVSPSTVASSSGSRSASYGWIRSAVLGPVRTDLC